jgi:uncharacterized protein YcsI (UPF0317 family)
MSDDLTHAVLSGADLSAIRAAIRAGRYARHTAGLAPGRLQVNLAILPADLAGDFRRFCLLNPRPCPLLGVSEPGEPRIPRLGAGIDLRTDAPRYCVYRDGQLVGTPTDLLDLWRDDFVAFALGCSFTFERAISEAGLPLAHVARDATVPMFRTTIETAPAGPFGGGMVVSMRPLPQALVAQAAAISARYPHAHGGPVHVGDPAAIGIADLSRPDWGDAVPVAPGEVPMFWACGVTPQAAILRAAPPIAVTHAPGHMLITDANEYAGDLLIAA